MKTLIRFFALAFVTLAPATFCRANWYNHPICSGSTILSWHSTYNDFNKTDFKSPDSAGPAVPAANLRGIKDYAQLFDGNKRGGSYPIWNGPSRTVKKGWVNVKVYYKSNGSVDHYVVSFSTVAEGTPQYFKRF